MPHISRRRGVVCKAQAVPTSFVTQGSDPYWKSSFPPCIVTSLTKLPNPFGKGLVGLSQHVWLASWQCNSTVLLGFYTLYTMCRAWQRENCTAKDFFIVVETSQYCQVKDHHNIKNDEMYESSLFCLDLVQFSIPFVFSESPVSSTYSMSIQSGNPMRQQILIGFLLGFEYFDNPGSTHNTGNVILSLPKNNLFLNNER